jgi:penicillin-binding protein 1A
MRHPREAITRQRHGLDNMLAAGFITVEEHAAARDEPIEFAARKTTTYDVAPWYVDHVRSLLESEYGPEFASLGLQVHTALDLYLQDAAEVTLHEGLRTIERRLGVRTPSATCRRTASRRTSTDSARAVRGGARSRPS